MTVDPAGHGPHHVLLVAIIDAHVGIGRPDKYAVDSAISLLEVIQIAIHRVLACQRIVEITVMHHHLRLEKTRLRPLDNRKRVAARIIADTNAAFRAPMCQVGKPLRVCKPCQAKVEAHPNRLRALAATRPAPAGSGMLTACGLLSVGLVLFTLLGGGAKA